MKIMLILYVCAAVGGVCDTLVKETPFDEWDSCTRAGSTYTLEGNKEAGRELVHN